MKALFLVFYGFQEYNGISKKIRYQISALEKCGMDVRTCYYEVTPNGGKQWMIDDEVLADLGKGVIAKLKKRISFHAIIRYIIKERIPFIYIRSYHNANPFTIHFVKALKNHGVKIFLEIPTYPYDQEYFSIKEKIELYTDKLFRHTFCKYVDAIITYSNDTEIFGRGHHQHLRGPRAVRIGEHPRHGRLALHDQGYVLVVGEHVVHHALHRVQPDDVLHQTFARAVGFGAVARQEFQYGAVRHQREDEDKEQQCE